MFNTYEFIFAGVPSSMYGLYVCDVGSTKHTDNAFGNKADIIEARIPGRVRPLHSGVDYNASPLSFELIFGSDRPLDRWELQEIQHWLTGYQQYQWLSIEQPDLAGVQYHCLVTELKPISVGWLPYAFEAQITCDCPYAYGYPIEETIEFNDDDEIYLYNNGSAREMFKPKLTIQPSANCTRIAFENTSDRNRVFELSDLPADGAEIFVDNENCILQELKTNMDLYEGFNNNWFRLVPGENIIKVTGSGTMTMTGRHLYNVGA